MVQELEATVGLEVNADDLLNELKDIFQNAAGLIESSVGGKGGVSSPADEEEDETQSGMFTTLKSMLGFVGKIFAGVSIMAVVMKVFQPVMTLVNSGLKLLAELLRPIADIVMLLLAPLLSLIKPIVVTMKTLMAPFKAAAQQLAISGGAALRAGDTTAGIEMLMASVATMLGPFVVIITGESLKLASNILLSGIELLVNSVVTLFGPIIEFFGGNVDDIKAKISEGFNFAKESINNAITGLELDILQSMANGVNSAMVHFKEEYPEYTKNLNQITTDFSGMEIAAVTLNTDLDTLESNMNITDSVNKFAANMEKVRKELSKSLTPPKEKRDFIGSGGSIREATYGEKLALAKAKQRDKLKRLFNM